MVNDKFFSPLPENWIWATIGEVTQPIEKVSPQEEPDQKFLYIDISSIDNQVNKIINPKEYFGRGAPSRARQQVKKNDIVFSTVRTYLKNIALVPAELDNQVASTGFSILRANQKVLPKYLLFYSLSDEFIDNLGMLQRGTSYPAVRDADVRAQRILIPPLNEQELIVAKIEELFSKLDAGVDGLKRVQAALKRYRASILKSAFTGKLVPQNMNEESIGYVLQSKFGKDYGEIIKPSESTTSTFIPAGWSYGKLDKLIYIAGRIGWRGLKAEEYTHKGPMLLSVYNLNRGDAVDFTEVKHISKERYQESPEIMVQENDILLAKDGAGIGKIAIVKSLPSEATVNSSLLVIRASEVFHAEFLFYLLMGPQMQDIVRKRITGSATPHLFQRDIKNFTLLIPPLDEQERIVTEIKRYFSVVYKLERIIEDEIKRANKIRQAILKNAFNGELTKYSEI